MNTLFQLSTSYIILGTLFEVMPIATWLALAPLRTPAVRVWCWAGALFGVGVLLIGMRQALPAWLSYAIANGLVWFSCMMMLKALRMELKLSLPWRHMVVSVFCMLLGFEYFRTIGVHPVLRFNWSMSIVLLLSCLVSWTAFNLHRREKSKSALLIAITYGFASAGVGLRMARTLLGYAHPDIMISAADGLIMSITIFPVAILGNMGYIGLYMERLKAREIAAALEDERAESRARLGAQIAHLDRQRSMAEMSAALAHELGQPLTAAQMDCHVAEMALSRMPQAPHTLSEALTSLRGSITRSAQIISRIHDFIKGRDPVFLPVRWEDIFRDVIDLIPSKERPPGAQVTWHSVEQNLDLLADRVQLSQVLLNLLRNAFQAADPLMPLKIQLIQTRRGADVVLTIVDNGMGMARDTLSQVGSAFFTTKPEGLGVGLAIARNIIEQHGGKLRIDSAPGQGTQIEISLPLHAA